MGVGRRADRSSGMASAKAMGRVEDERQTAASGDRFERGDIGRVAEGMHADDRGGARSDRLFDGGRIERRRAGIDIGEHRSSAAQTRALTVAMKVKLGAMTSPSSPKAR